MVTTLGSSVLNSKSLTFLCSVEKMVTCRRRSARLSLSGDTYEKNHTDLRADFGRYFSLIRMATVLFAGTSQAEVVGYTIIVLSLLLVFFGIRSHRDNAGTG